MERSKVASALTEVHALLERDAGFHLLVRLAAARYDQHTGFIQAVAYTGSRVETLDGLSCPLGDVPSLAILASGSEPRVIADLEQGARGPLTRELLAAGCRSSLTFPVWRGERFQGFVFFDAGEAGYFDPDRVARLAQVAGMIAGVL